MPITDEQRLARNAKQRQAYAKKKADAEADAKKASAASVIKSVVSRAVANKKMVNMSKGASVLASALKRGVANRAYVKEAEQSMLSTKKAGAGKSPKKATITSIKDANGKWSIISTFFDKDGVSPIMRMPFEYFNELEIVEVSGGHSVKRAKKLGKSIATMNGGEVVYKYFTQSALQDTDTGRYLENLIDDAMGKRARTTLDWGLTGLLLEDPTTKEKELFWISEDNSKAYNFALTGYYRINKAIADAKERAEPQRAEREAELRKTMAMDESLRRIVKMSKRGAK